jgi:hypothetical protein
VPMAHGTINGLHSPWNALTMACIPAPDLPTTIDEALLQCTWHDQWATQSLECSDNDLSVARTIINGTAKAIIDVLFKDKMGTSAIVLYGDDHSKQMMCGNAPPKHGDEQSVYHR